MKLNQTKTLSEVIESQEALIQFREALSCFEELNCLTVQQRIVTNGFIQLIDYEKTITTSDIKALYAVVSVVYHNMGIDFKQTMLGVFIRTTLLNVLEASLDAEITGMAIRKRAKTFNTTELDEWIEAMQEDFESSLNESSKCECCHDEWNHESEDDVYFEFVKSTYICDKCEKKHSIEYDFESWTVVSSESDIVITSIGIGNVNHEMPDFHCCDNPNYELLPDLFESDVDSSKQFFECECCNTKIKINYISG
ncbi:hypothetical protein [Vibrio penaeicida]|uniref:hypothetical protein n=1 Tax=Vibrio penaeicida TaxID=104609 RepID=UPI001CC6755C|nr:hypothetical protein [Vibrio penaeicida]